MANEYLTRSNTSSGNRQVWTWSGWVKRSNLSSDQQIFASRIASSPYGLFYYESSGKITFADSSVTTQYTWTPLFRDSSSWQHILLVVNTPEIDASKRLRLYVNGIELSKDSGTDATRNSYTTYNLNQSHSIGSAKPQTADYFGGEFADIFFIDGQALTPDVFGFYKDGNGYISAGSTQATDFRPGQWVPKTPRVIKAQIERNGGFGVNGFYLPMNDSSNFGADFHTTPNSIITLKGEDLPQPRNGAPTTTDAYVSQLRTDPYAANLVLAVPGISGGQGSGYGDYSADIKGSGSNKTVTANGNAGIAVTASYYGSALSFDGSGDYFTIPDSDDWYYTGDFTAECWIYPVASPNQPMIMGQWSGSTGGTGLSWTILLSNDSNRYLRAAASSNGSGVAFDLISSAPLPLNQWSHICYEKTNSTVYTLYLNGVAVGIRTDGPSSLYNATNSFTIGATSGNTQPFNGYIQDLRVYKGVAKYKGGFDVPKLYTPVGIGTWRAVPDCTANNFATWSSNSGFAGRNSSNVRAGGATFTDGNLTWYRTQNSNPIYSTINVRTGKYYWEYLIRGNTRTSYGIVRTPHDGGYGDEFANAGDYAYMHESGQTKIINGSSSSAGSYFASVPSVNDTIGVAFDADAGQLWFSKNGTFGNSGNPAAGTNALITGITTDTQYNFAVFGGGDYPASATLQGSTNFGQNPTFSGQTTAGTFTDSNGKGLFKYEPPSDFLALCEDNLPTPAIKNPGEHFKTVLYAGDGNVGRSIVGVGFTPDLVWIKSRTNGVQNHGLYDSVRGAGFRLMSNLTNAESYNTNKLKSFDNDGFVTDGANETNESGNTFVAWCWRAGAGTTTANTDGSINSVVSVNQDAGFSIVSFTGTGASGATVGHGLGRKPAFIVSKSRDNGTYAWHCWHKGLGTDYYINLNGTGGQDNSVNIFPSAGITSTVYQTATSALKYNNFANEKYIAYCWAEIEGFSKFGSFVGNGSADGAFVYCGFKPAWVLFKRSSSTSSWVIWDTSRSPTNPLELSLAPNLTNIEESTPDRLDFVSNGFKLRSSAFPNDGATIIFAAFAESPINYSNAK